MGALEDDEKIKKKKKKTKRKKKGLLDKFSKGGISNESTDYAKILDNLLVTEDDKAAKASKVSKKRKRKMKRTPRKTPAKSAEDNTDSTTPGNSLESAPLSGFFDRSKSDGSSKTTQKL